MRSRLFLAVLFVVSFGSTCSRADESAEKQVERETTVPAIEVWYGEKQSFGKLGHSQPLINILGSITHPELVGDRWYQVNRGPRKQFFVGPDLHRLARPGDFNLEVDRSSLKAGENTVRIHCRTLKGVDVDEEVIIDYTPKTVWPLPYEVNFSELASIQNAVDVIDGKWKLTAEGARTESPYYDRQLAVGDTTWKDFEVEAEIIFHRHFVNFEGRNTAGPPYLSHAHTSFTLRWEGYPDDGKLPRRDWQNLGCLVALRCDLAQRNAGSFWWMHFGRQLPGERAKRSLMTKDTRHKIDFETPYRYRMRVETVAETRARYRTKVWRSSEAEPDAWQMEAVDESERVAAGALVFVVHHSDVTLCKLRVDPLND